MSLGRIRLLISSVTGWGPRATAYAPSLMRTPPTADRALRAASAPASPRRALRRVWQPDPVPFAPSRSTMAVMDEAIRVDSPACTLGVRDHAFPTPSLGTLPVPPTIE